MDFNQSQMFFILFLGIRSRKREQPWTPLLAGTQYDVIASHVGGSFGDGEPPDDVIDRTKQETSGHDVDPQSPSARSGLDVRLQQ